MPDWMSVCTVLACLLLEVQDVAMLDNDTELSSTKSVKSHTWACQVAVHS